MKYKKGLNSNLHILLQNNILGVNHWMCFWWKRVSWYSVLLIKAGFYPWKIKYAGGKTDIYFEEYDFFFPEWKDCPCPLTWSQGFRDSRVRSLLRSYLSRTSSCTNTWLSPPCCTIQEGRKDLGLEKISNQVSAVSHPAVQTSTAVLLQTVPETLLLACGQRQVAAKAPRCKRWH